MDNWVNNWVAVCYTAVAISVWAAWWFERRIDMLRAMYCFVCVFMSFVLLYSDGVQSLALICFPVRRIWPRG